MARAKDALRGEDERTEKREQAPALHMEFYTGSIIHLGSEKVKISFSEWGGESFNSSKVFHDQDESC
jgi:hypothetical protein